VDFNDIFNDFNGLVNDVCMIGLLILTYWGIKKEDKHRKYEIHGHKKEVKIRKIDNGRRNKDKT
jgi:hypothetical protein